MNKGALALVEFLAPPPQSRDCVHAATRIPSVEQLPCEQLLDRGPFRGVSKGAKPPDLLTNLLTPKALESQSPDTAAFLRDYTLSLLSSRSCVRITQGALVKRSVSARVLQHERWSADHFRLACALPGQALPAQDPQRPFAPRGVQALAVEPLAFCCPCNRRSNKISPTTVVKLTISTRAENCTALITPAARAVLANTKPGRPRGINP